MLSTAKFLTLKEKYASNKAICIEAYEFGYTQIPWLMLIVLTYNHRVNVERTSFHVYLFHAHIIQK